MMKPYGIGFVSMLLIGLASAEPLKNCDESKWLPVGSEPPHQVECVKYDGSLIPDCDFFHNNHSSYFHVHEYNCNRYWECSPEGPCLFECAYCNVGCEGYEGLTFDCRYQYPDGPVCDWPYNVDCTNNHPCEEECCSDDDCPSGQCVDGSCSNSCEHCEDWQTCVDGECAGCRTGDDCTGMTCSTCDNNICVDPECCSNDDCPTGYCSDAGTCEGECSDDTDCQSLLSMDCSECIQHVCSDPECCFDIDCPAGYICQDNGCIKEGECDAERPCDNANNMCDVPNYTNCAWCDLTSSECKPGCDSDSNCPEDKPLCTGHKCISRAMSGVVSITITTSTCSLCEGSGNPLGNVEGGVQVVLQGDYGTSCHSNGLDNLERVDYDNGKTAFFDGTPDDDDDDDGLGSCKLADLKYGLTGGSATWTGPGEWTAAESEPVCIKFYDPDNNKPTCCCKLSQRTLSKDETSDLSDCQCHLK